MDEGFVPTMQRFYSGPLSNFHKCKFEVDGRSYTTTEQYMHAEKAKLFGDTDVYKAICDCDDPGLCKQLGRTVSGFDETRWQHWRELIVIRGCFHKFKQNPELKALLIDTADNVLVEATSKDLIWGCGLDIKDDKIDNLLLWPGENLLGFALMSVRRRLAMGEGLARSYKV